MPASQSIVGVEIQSTAQIGQPDRPSSRPARMEECMLAGETLPFI